MRRFTSSLLIAALAQIIAGCGSSRIIFTARGADFPVSITEGFYDDNHELVLLEGYEVLHRFELEYSNFSIFRFSSPKHVDLTDTLSKMVKTYDADAVVNLEVTTSGTPSLSDCGCLTGYLTFGLVVPAKVKAVVTGDIVKVAKGSSFLPTDMNEVFLVRLRDCRSFYLPRAE